MEAALVMLKRQHGINDVYIYRDVGRMQCLFSDIFIGFDRLECVRRMFGKETLPILTNLDVRIFDGEGYMWVDPDHAALMVNRHYLENGSKRDIYLDAIHELVHVRQLLEGKQLFDERYKYVNRPTEIEAYKIAVKEGRRIGMNKEELEEYLKVDWISKEELERLCINVGLEKQIRKKPTKKKKIKMQKKKKVK
jgi:hypothetical protein